MKENTSERKRRGKIRRLKKLKVNWRNAMFCYFSLHKYLFFLSLIASKYADKKRVKNGTRVLKVAK